MRYCQYCGTPLEEDDRFCVSCGKPVTAATAAPMKPAGAGRSQGSLDPYSSEDGQKAPSGGSMHYDDYDKKSTGSGGDQDRRRIALVAAAALALLIFVFGIFKVLSGNRQAEQEPLAAADQSGQERAGQDQAGAGDAEKMADAQTPGAEDPSAAGPSMREEAGAAQAEPARNDGEETAEAGQNKEDDRTAEKEKAEKEKAEKEDEEESEEEEESAEEDRDTEEEAADEQRREPSGREDEEGEHTGVGSIGQLMEEEDEEASDETGEEEDEEASDETGEEDPEEDEMASYATDSGYILADSDKRAYSREELSRLDDYSLQMAINEIYARHGRKFDSPEIRDYFENKTWYQGTVDPADFDGTENSRFNEYEIRNRELLAKIRDERSSGGDDASEQ